MSEPASAPAPTAGARAGAPSAGATPPPGRRRGPYAGRRRGEATAEQVAEQLRMTVSGARQHLTALVEDGLAEATESEARGRRGRRALLYNVSPAGDSLFPKAYAELTNELLGYLADEQPSALELLFARRRDQRIGTAPQRPAPPSEPGQRAGPR